jgi:hypothetical protein
MNEMNLNELIDVFRLLKQWREELEIRTVVVQERQIQIH